MAEKINEDNIDEAKETAQGILKHGLLSQEYEQEYVEKYEGEGMADLLIDVSDTMIGNATNKERELRLMILTFSFGSEHENEKVINHALKRMAEWEDEYDLESGILQQVQKIQQAKENPMQ